MDLNVLSLLVSGAALAAGGLCLLRVRTWRRAGVSGGPAAAPKVEGILRELHERSRHRHGQLHLHDVEEVLRRELGG